MNLILAAFLITGCTSNPVLPDARYSFPEYEQISSLSNFSLMGWDAVDSQSLIIQTGPSDYYLLILGRKMHDLNFAETIILSSTGNRIEARFDCVEVVEPRCPGGSIPAVIQTIYRLPGSESVEYVKKRIRPPD